MENKVGELKNEEDFIIAYDVLRRRLSEEGLS